MVSLFVTTNVSGLACAGGRSVLSVPQPWIDRCLDVVADRLYRAIALNNLESAGMGTAETVISTFIVGATHKNPILPW